MRTTSVASRPAAADAGAPSLPERSSRATSRNNAGSAAGFVGGAGIARAMSATTSAGSGAIAPSACAHPSRAITASRASNAHARSRSTSAASNTGPARPSPSDAHTNRPRGSIGAQSNATISSPSSSPMSETVGDTRSPSCHADARIASAASQTSSSILRRATPSAAPPTTPPRAARPTKSAPTSATTMHVIHAARRVARHAARHAAASACIVFPRMSPPSRWPPPSSARDTTAVSRRS